MSLPHLDDLTGQLSPRAFRRRLHEEAEQLLGVERPFGLIVLELDDDADGALAEAAERLSALTRAIDSVGRVGETSLAWILPDVPAVELLDAVERLRAAIAIEPFAGGIPISAAIEYLTVS